MPFIQMENISLFLDKMSFLGVASHERFMTVDLYEAKNMNQVLYTILSIIKYILKGD